MPRAPRTSFDRAAFEAGLQQLGAAIGKSPLLAPLCPIELVASGGYVSVIYLRNRNASQDLDYFLSVQRLGDSYEQVRVEMKRLIEAVAKKLGYDPLWANDEVRVLLGLLDDPQALFNQSKAQNVVLHRDDSIVIYAVKWEWVLARKLKRLQMDGQPARSEDWKDCVAIAKLLYDRQGGRLSPRVVQLFDNVQRESPVLPKTIADLRRLVLEIYRVDAFPVATWTFTSSSSAFQYGWNDGTAITRDLWPALQGRITVYLPDHRQWKYYDCDTQTWSNVPRDAIK